MAGGCVGFLFMIAAAFQVGLLLQSSLFLLTWMRFSPTYETSVHVLTKVLSCKFNQNIKLMELCRLFERYVVMAKIMVPFAFQFPSIDTIINSILLHIMMVCRQMKSCRDSFVSVTRFIAELKSSKQFLLDKSSFPIKQPFKYKQQCHLVNYHGDR